MRNHKPTQTSPRVEAVIDAVMKRYPGESKGAQARYFEAVHQELTPLARALEHENSALRDQLAAQEAMVREQFATPRTQPQGPGMPGVPQTDIAEPGEDERAEFAAWARANRVGDNDFHFAIWQGARASQSGQRADDTPVWYVRQVHQDHFPEFNKVDEFSDGQGGGEALYRKPQAGQLVCSAAGWLSVPVEPTEEMVNAGALRAIQRMVVRQVYEAMITAAPKQHRYERTVEGLVPLPKKMPASIFRHETLGDLYDRLAVHTYAVGYAMQCLATQPRQRTDFTAEHRQLIENAIMALDDGVAAGSEHANDLRHVLAVLTHQQAGAAEEIAEGIEILNNIIDSVREHGNYSPEAMGTFLNQAQQCFDAAVRASVVTTACPVDSCDIDDGVRRLIRADAAQPVLNEPAVRELATEHCHSVSSNSDDQESETAWEFTDDSLLTFTQAILSGAGSITAAPNVTGADEGVARVDALFKNRLTPYGMLVRALRVAAGATLYDMAQHMAVSSAYLSDLEFGRKDVTSDHVSAAAKFFHRYAMDTQSALTAALQANGEVPAKPGAALEHGTPSADETPRKDGHHG